MNLKPRPACFPPPLADGKNLSGAGGYQTVVLAAAAGDSKAFAELVKRFQGMASTVARRWFDDKGLVEDAVQEAFLKAFLELSSLRDARAFPSWFRKILHSCCNRLKKQQRLLLPDNGEALKFLPDPTPGPYEQMVRYQSRAIVAKTLNALDGVAREVLALVGIRLQVKQLHAVHRAAGVFMIVAFQHQHRRRRTLGEVLRYHRISAFVPFAA